MHVYMYIYVCIYVCVLYTHICVYVQVQIHIHTHLSLCAKQGNLVNFVSKNAIYNTSTFVYICIK